MLCNLFEESFLSGVNVRGSAFIVLQCVLDSGFLYHNSSCLCATLDASSGFEFKTEAAAPIASSVLGILPLNVGIRSR